MPHQRSSKTFFLVSLQNKGQPKAQKGRGSTSHATKRHDVFVDGQMNEVPAGGSWAFHETNIKNKAPEESQKKVLEKSEREKRKRRKRKRPTGGYQKVWSTKTFDFWYFIKRKRGRSYIILEEVPDGKWPRCCFWRRPRFVLLHLLQDTTGSAWQEVHNMKYTTGSSWQEVNNKKCMTGSAWQEVHDRKYTTGSAQQEVHDRKYKAGSAWQYL